MAGVCEIPELCMGRPLIKDEGDLVVMTVDESVSSRLSYLDSVT
jgi:hypothetical protein